MTSSPTLRALGLMVAAGLVASTVGLAAAGATSPGTPGPSAQAGGSTTEPQPAPGQQRLGRWQARLQQHLGLTDDQASQLGQVFQRSMQAARPHHQAIRAARAELRRLVLIEADQASIQAKEAELQQLLAQSVTMRVQTLREIAPILTPEQREKFAAMMDKHGHFGGRHRHHRSPATPRTS